MLVDNFVHFSSATAPIVPPPSVSGARPLNNNEYTQPVSQTFPALLLSSLLLPCENKCHQKTNKSNKNLIHTT
jgi:hypothetical protein